MVENRTIGERRARDMTEDGGCDDGTIEVHPTRGIEPGVWATARAHGGSGLTWAQHHSSNEANAETFTRHELLQGQNGHGGAQGARGADRLRRHEK